MGDRQAKDPVPEQGPGIHVSVKSSIIVAFLTHELTPLHDDHLLVAGKHVLPSTIDAMQYSQQSRAAAPTSKPSQAPSVSGTPAVLSASHDTEPVAMGKMEECHWLNVLIHRFFLSFRASLMFKERWTERMSRKLNMRLKSNAFVTSIQIKELSLGDHSPQITGIRLLKGVTKDLAVIGEADVSYQGGGSILLEVVLTAGVTIPARVFLNQFTGSIRIRTPSVLWPDMIGVTFVKDPGISFTVETGSGGENDFVRGMINKVVASIVRKTFLELWVLPSWRTFFLPQMQPSAEEYAELSKEKAKEKLASATKDTSNLPSQPTKQTLAGRATALWESRVRRGSKPQHKDMLQGTTFETSIELTSAQLSQVDEMDQSLTDSFLRLAHEPVNTAVSSTASDTSTLHEKGATVRIKPTPSCPVDDNSVSGVSRDHSHESSPTTTTLIDTTAIAVPLQPAAACEWRTIKNKGGIHIQKRMQGDAVVTDVVRAFITIECDPERVARVLTNPEHFGHIYDSFEDAHPVYEFDPNRIVLSSKFKLGRAVSKSLLLFSTRRDRCATRKPPAETGDPLGRVPSLTKAAFSSDNDLVLARNDAELRGNYEFVIVMRSISSFRLAGSKRNKSKTTQNDSSPQPHVYTLSTPDLIESGGNVGWSGSKSMVGLDTMSSTINSSETAIDKPKSILDGVDSNKIDLSASSSRQRSQSFGIDLVKSAVREAPSKFKQASRNIASTGSLSTASNLLNSSLSALGDGEPLLSPLIPANLRNLEDMTVPDSSSVKSTQDAKSQSDVYIYGYLVESSHENPEHSKVTIISHFSSELQRLEVDYNSCRKLKQFIEELDQFTRGTHPSSVDSADQINEIRHRRLFPFSNTGEPGADSLSISSEGRQIDKIKSYIGSTASYLLKGRKGLGSPWLSGNTTTAYQESTDDSDIDDQSSLGEKKSSSSHTVVDSKTDNDSGSDVAPSDSAQSGRSSLTRNPIHGSNLPIESKPMVSPSRQPKSLAALLLNQQRPASMSLHGSDRLFTNSPNIASDFTVIEPRRSLTYEMTEFGCEPYIERILHPKEVVRVEIPFNRFKYGTAVVFEWEHMMRMESALYFGITFTPDELPNDPSDMVNLVPLVAGSSISRSLFPVSAVQSYMGPAYGTTDISSFGSGVFILTWEPQNSQPKKQSRSFAYKCLVHNIDPGPQYWPATVELTDEQHNFTIKNGACVEVVVHRKSYFALPLIYDTNLVSSSAENYTAQTALQWEFSTGGYDITFAIYFDPVMTPSTTHSLGLFGMDTATSNTTEAISTSASTPSQSNNLPVDINHDRLDVGITNEVVDGTDASQTRSFESDPKPKSVSNGDSTLTKRTLLSQRLAAVVGRDTTPSPEPGSQDGNVLPSTTSSPSLAAVASPSMPPDAPLPTAVLSPATTASSQSKRTTVTSIIASRLAAARSTVAHMDISASGLQRTQSITPVHVNAEFLAAGSARRQCIVPPSRINSLRGNTVMSMPVTHKYGVYTLLWDNSTSVVTSRTIALKAHLVTTSHVVDENKASE
ncbi:hypothetical protein BSLG_008146 [Batrachochytrium salamandrivorans]|nr:hypothetical protein BSLG_008146 [Batrachochytrium salamandrivorans]